MNESRFEQQILTKLGEISGELKGLHALVASHEAGMNRRFDDVQRAWDQRMATAGRRVGRLERDFQEFKLTAETKFEGLNSVIHSFRNKVVAGAAGGGGGVVALVEIMRFTLGGS